MTATEAADTFVEEVTVITRHEDAQLVQAARRGDRRSRECLVADYLPVVRSIALRYRDLGLPVEDLMQEGSLGLLEAIDRYEPDRSADFESYARFRIRRTIRNALTEQSRLIRLPKQIVERRRTIERAEASLKSETGRTPTPVELAEATGLSPTAVIATRSVGTTPVSLDEAVLDDGSTLEALVADNSARDPEDETVEHERVQEIDDAVETLPARQREILSRHFGLGCDAQQIADVAAALHVSQQRVRAIERDALYALRDQLEPVVTPPPIR
jgi:RNA polymerase primary sigma factor